MAATDEMKEKILPADTVVIAGGGPVGLLVATILAKYNVKSVIVERNKSTTKWPKMDLTNGRSMEILRRLGLADDLRAKGVPSHIPQPVLFSTGLSADSAITKWSHPSVDEFRDRIRGSNDGTQPREAWQRVSQVIFEAWLKDLCDVNPLIDLRYGWKVINVTESDGKVTTTVENVDSSHQLRLVSDYVAGCDGASSKIRQSLQLPLDGGPVPACVLLIHFKSRDLTKLHKQGQFWHIFFLQQSGLFSGALIAQDEIDTWTVHKFMPLDVDETKIDSHQAIYDTLGGSHEPYPIEVDEILVRSVWRPNIAVARQWSSPGRRVFIAGDAAHQLIPTGGYGMNTGIGDAYDLAWKLAAVINGYAGQALLESYEPERRPVALRNSERSGTHMQVHQEAASLLSGHDISKVSSNAEEASDVRKKIHQYYQENDGENTDFGIEMGYRYRSSVIVTELEDGVEPESNASIYIPTTWPGSRPPHLFLRDGQAIFDLFHPTGWTLVTFCNDAIGAEYFSEAALGMNVPLKHLSLPLEEHAKLLWEKDMVLVRPDQHVAWRGQSIASLAAAKDVLATVTGNTASVGTTFVGSVKPQNAFAATTGMKTQTDSFIMEKASGFQT